MAAGMAFIDKKADLEALLDTIVTTESSGNHYIPRLYVALISRNGIPALLTLMIHPQMDTYIIDISTLDKIAFHTKDKTGVEDLKSVLESEDIVKVFFDVRRDSYALDGHFDVRLAGVHDLQLMEVATRPKRVPKLYLNGIGNCIKKAEKLSHASCAANDAIQEKAINLFNPKYGGSYTVFDARPLCEDIKRYCVQSVYLMPELWTEYREKMSEF
jgi:exonuclease 3'-5' domain-containing protein 1